MSKCLYCNKEMPFSNKFCNAKCYKSFNNVDQDTPIGEVKNKSITINDIPMEDI